MPLKDYSVLWQNRKSLLIASLLNDGRALFKEFLEEWRPFNSAIVQHPLYANMPNHPLDLFHLLNSSELLLGSTTVNFQSIQNLFLTSFIEAKSWSNIIKVSDAFLDLLYSCVTTAEI